MNSLKKMWPNRLAFLGMPLAVLLLGQTQKAFGLANVGGGVLTATGKVSLSHDSNIYGHSNAGASDDIYSFDPTLNFRREGGLITTNASMGVNMAWFRRNSSQNYKDFHANLSSNLPFSPGSPISGDLSVGYVQSHQINQFVNERLKRSSFNFATNMTYQVGARTGVRAGVTYGDSSNTSYAGETSYGIRLGAQRLISGTLNSFLDYSYQRDKSKSDSQFGRNVDNRNHSINIGLSDSVSPHLNGSISVGVQRTDAKGSGRQSSTEMVANGNVSWAARPRTTFTLILSKSVDVTPAAQTVNATRINVGAVEKIGDHFSANGSIGYQKLGYRGNNPRKDNVYSYDLGLTYAANEYVSAGVSWSYNDSQSDIAFSNYSRSLVSIFTSLTY